MGMRVSFEWLKDFVDITASPQEVADRLTMAGLEIEGSETVNGDPVFEVNVTPNRPDCLSILGVAREVASSFKLPLKIPVSTIPGDIPSADFRVEILDPELCSRYTGRLITGVRTGDSPQWLKDRLEKCGIRSLGNNVVDITNYVLLEFGHPLHAFDADKLRDRTIRVAKAGKAGVITTLDGTERKLPEEALLVWDAKEPVAVAGIMGGEESGVTSGTRNIFLESAWFEPTSIRRTSKALGLKSESSYRFERGTDIEFLVMALDRAALLMKETGGGTIHGIVDAYPVPYEPPVIEVSCDRVNALLGTSLQKDDMLGILSGIGMKTEDRENFFTLSPPAYRRDVKEYIDVVEEVARLYGYRNIPVRVPKTPLSGGMLNRREIMIRAVRESMRKAGFTDVVNYSFMNPSELDMLGITVDDRRRKHLGVRNPLRREDSLMRTTLVPSLLNNFIYNLSRGTREIRFFEVSRVFVDEGRRLPSEELRLGGILYRENTPSLWKEDVPAFFIAKGAVQSLFEELKIREISYIPSSQVFLHRGKSADITAGAADLGFIGEIGPSVVEHLDLKVSKPEIIVFELDLEALLALAPEKLVYSPIPKYPAIERDVAIVLDDSISASEVLEQIRGYRSEFIESAELFDHYKGKNIARGRKSLAFRVIYRRRDRTLTDAEVESIHQELVEHLLKKTGGELRGPA
jgi:phenylalanyl-tRNA synthetase beta chain